MKDNKECSNTDNIYVLTLEGSKKFFELMAKPNPKAKRTARLGKKTYYVRTMRKAGQRASLSCISSKKEKN